MPKSPDRLETSGDLGGVMVSDKSGDWAASGLAHKPMMPTVAQ